MGIYINIGNEGFRRIRNSEYVDKSGLIGIVNETLFTERCFSCVTRSRRFGKTMAAKMLLAYYDRSCDSRSLFADLKIASHSSFEKHLNKYPVISIDAGFFVSKHRKRTVVDDMDAEIIQEVCSYYPDVPVLEKDDLMQYLIRVSLTTNDRFIFIIDEWDAILRECGHMMYDEKQNVTDRYVDWLRHLFKSEPATQVFAGVYMTGILPIKKYETQSALNNFIEYSMVTPGPMARYFGFTKDEVHALAERHGMDFDELEMWYDGYQIGPETSMFNPNSVMEAIRNDWCDNYWSKTGAYDAVADYINMNYEGLKDDIIDLLAGNHARVDPKGFSNDLSDVRSSDDVFTVLIHLGYLSYDRRVQECFIPNREVAGEMENAIKANKWEGVVKAPEEKVLINTINAHSYNTAQKDDAFAEALSTMENGKLTIEDETGCVKFLIPDGASIIKACRWLKAKSQPKERIAGWELLHPNLTFAVTMLSKRIYIYIIVVITVLSIVGCTGCGDTKNAAQSDSALNADFAQTMAEADSLHNNMQFRDAYDLYLKLLDSEEARDNSVKRLNVFHEGNREP